MLHSNKESIACSTRFDHVESLGPRDLQRKLSLPLSHPFVERLIGSIRRDLLDHTFFWTSTDLENKLLHYQCYYNHSRWQPHCRGLMELPIAA